MQLDRTVNEIVTRVKNRGYGAVFTLDEILNWLNVSESDDCIWMIDQVGNQLIVEYNIALELEFTFDDSEKISFTTRVPEKTEFRAAEIYLLSQLEKGGQA
jgi:hypothetical protein